MKQFIKYAFVGAAGYLIGHYEFKYKVVKCIALEYIEKDQKEDSEKEGEA